MTSAASQKIYLSFTEKDNVMVEGDLIDPISGTLVPSDGTGMSKESSATHNNVTYEIIEGGSSKVRFYVMK